MPMDVAPHYSGFPGPLAIYLLPLPNTRYIFLIGRTREATALVYRFKSNSLNCYHSAVQAGMVTRLAMVKGA